MSTATGSRPAATMRARGAGAAPALVVTLALVALVLAGSAWGGLLLGCAVTARVAFERHSAAVRAAARSDATAWWLFGLQVGSLGGCAGLATRAVPVPDSDDDGESGGGRRVTRVVTESGDCAGFDYRAQVARLLEFTTLGRDPTIAAAARAAFDTTALAPDAYVAFLDVVAGRIAENWSMR